MVYLSRKKEYDENKKSVSYNDLARQLTLIKQQEEYKLLNETNAVVLQQSLRHLDTAYNNFFRRIKNKQGVGYPKFKSKHNHNDSATYTSVKVNFDTMRLFVPKIGWIKLCKNRTFDTDLKTTSMTISCDACGTFWVSILVYTNTDIKQPKSKKECNRTIGLDLGLKTFITDNQGNKVENPKYLELNTKRLTHLQRQLSRKVKGSNRGKEQESKLQDYIVG